MSRLATRVIEYYKKAGFLATFQRSALAVKRMLCANRSVLFYHDLAKQTEPPEQLPDLLRVERIQSMAELSREDFSQIVNLWNPKLAQYRIKERFDRKASLWIIRFEGKLAGYGWTLRGSTIDLYYFPIGADDVQFFDFHVIARYRGRALDWFLIRYIFWSLAAEGCARAFAEAGSGMNPPCHLCR